MTPSFGKKKSKIFSPSFSIRINHRQYSVTWSPFDQIESGQSLLQTFLWCGDNYEPSLLILILSESSGESQAKDRLSVTFNTCQNMSWEECNWCITRSKSPRKSSSRPVTLSSSSSSSCSFYHRFYPDTDKCPIAHSIKVTVKSVTSPQTVTVRSVSSSSWKGRWNVSNSVIILICMIHNVSRWQVKRLQNIMMWDSFVVKLKSYEQPRDR